MNNLLTTEQAAAKLKLSPKTVRAMIAAGKLPAEWFDKRTLMIKTSDLAAVAVRRKPGRPPSKPNR